MEQFNAATRELTPHLARWLSRSADPRASYDVGDDISLGTWIGRREENQDQVAFFRIRTPDPRENAAGLVLCDGMGGLKDGGLTARHAVASIISYLANEVEPVGHATLIRAIQLANQTIYNRYRGSSGATLSIVLFTTYGILAANVGDSRIYAFGHSGLTQLSTDDTLAAHIPPSEISGNQHEPELEGLVQYLGIGASLRVNTLQVPSDSNGRYIVSSDGAHFIGAALLSQLYLGAPRASLFVRRLLSLADWLGGTDNATVAVLPSSLRVDSPAPSSAMRALHVWDPSGKLEIWLTERAEESAKTAVSQMPSRKTAEPEKNSPRRKTKKANAKERSQKTQNAAPDVILQFGKSEAAADATAEDERAAQPSDSSVNDDQSVPKVGAIDPSAQVTGGETYPTPDA
jgi:serine/threonine protein phosphatase PrpC